MVHDTYKSVTYNTVKHFMKMPKTHEPDSKLAQIKQKNQNKTKIKPTIINNKYQLHNKFITKLAP